jgi:integrase
VASIKKRDDGKWRARYRDSGGREHAKHFARKVDAQRWLDEVTASVVTGQYVDPKAGKVSFRDYAEQWRAAQVHRDSSSEHVESRLRLHVYPTFGDRPLASILPSEVQAWVKRLATDDPASKRKALAPSSIGVCHGIVSSVFKSAIRDRRIMANPCEGTTLPEVEATKVRPATTEQVEQLAELMPPDLRALVIVAAGTGMRQGELFGLTVDRLNMLKREVAVDRQLVRLKGKPWRLGPVKTKASNRTIPLPQVVVDALAAHLAAYPPGEHGLVFARAGGPLSRQWFGHLFRPLGAAVGLDESTGTGLHALRHYYASLLIRYGESVKTVQARLGHATAAETLDTYSHLWPDSDDRTRDAIDSVLGASASAPADSLRTGDA